MPVNKCVSGGVEQEHIIQPNEHFPTVLLSKFGMRIIQVCILYANFCGILKFITVQNNNIFYCNP